MSTPHPEAKAARHWRKERMRLTLAQLSALSGYSVSAIHDFERGTYRGSNDPIPDEAFKRYRLACAAVAAGARFDWKSVRVNITETFEIDPA